MKKKLLSILPMVIVLLIGFFFRLFSLSEVPPSASLDEVSIGYNAYSILKTGADEYGTKFPMLLRAYDDWRPALYVYLVIPFVFLFDLSVAAVRLPSVILSVLTIIATYFLTKELFKNSTMKQFNNEKIALFASFLLAISPWHIYISRLGHEVNAGLAFFIFALTFFFKKQIFFSVIFFALSFVSYQSEKVFLPIFVLLLLMFYRKEIFSDKKQLLLGLLVSALLLIPFIQATLEPNALIRFQGTNVFEANADRFRIESVNLYEATKKQDLLGQIIHNRRFVALQILKDGYVSHFNPVWLFTNENNDRHKVPGIGLFYPWEAILIVFGLVVFLFSNVPKKIKILFIVWILASPLPAAITTDAPHAMRIYTILPLPQILSALALVSIYYWLSTLRFIKDKKYQLNIAGLSFTIFIILISIANIYQQYFIVFPKTQSSSFQYPLYKSIEYVLENQGKYNKIIFSNKDNLYQSYMFFLFYSRYDPNLYHKEGGTISGGYTKTHKFGKYEFRPINWESEKKGLFIGGIKDFPYDVSSIFKIKNLNNESEILIVNKDK